MAGLLDAQNRKDRLDFLVKRGFLTEAQAEAGGWLQDEYERAERVPYALSGANNSSGSKLRREEAVTDAKKRVERTIAALGEDGADFLNRVLVDQMTATEAAEAMGWNKNAGIPVLRVLLGALDAQRALLSSRNSHSTQSVPVIRAPAQSIRANT